MIVVDTNLLAYLLLPTTHAVQAAAVLLKDPDWVAPALIHSEFRNVLLEAVHPQGDRNQRCPCPAGPGDGGYHRAGRRGGRPGDAVLGARERMQHLRLRIRELARTLRAPLVTADRLVLGAFPDTAVPGDVFLATQGELGS